MRRLPLASAARPLPRVASARPDPPVAGEAALAFGDSLLIRLARALERVLPAEWNPLSQSGAIANVTFLVAAVSGVLLLVWYSPSVHMAHASLEAMRAQPLGAQLVRSIHRYSSDACMLFVLVHAGQLVLARRFTGARWLAWVTGLLLVGWLWLVGWLGYWLVWDEAARQIAVGTSKLLDVLPIFAEPMSSSFLTDGSINSLLFFIVFFVHMLVPLAMGVAIWLHIARLGRARFLTSRRMSAAIVGLLVAMSLAVPARSGAPARMTVLPRELTLDSWYLLPVGITDRVGAGALWAILLAASAVLFAAPWWIVRRRAPTAEVDVAKCNGCRLCSADCPYDAIELVPREDGRAFAVQAHVNPAKCVGCGVCAGSCDSSAIGFPELSPVIARQRMDAWVDAAMTGGEAPWIAFLCAGSAGAAMTFDPETGLCASLPGFRVMPVPCVGWVHMLTVERALRHGAAGVLLVSCGPSECTYREGAKWTRQRLAAERSPALRPGVDPRRVVLLELDRTRAAELVARAAHLRAEGSDHAPPLSRAARVVGTSLAVGALAALVVLPSRASYGGAPSTGSQLVVALRHAGRSSERCRKLGEDEKARLPPHMRRDEVCARGRANVRLRVHLDGVVRLERAYPPHGLRGDGNSIALERIAVAAGTHRVAVEIGDTWDPAEWTWSDARDVDLGPNDVGVVRFEKASGFTWEHTPGSEGTGTPDRHEAVAPAP